MAQKKMTARARQTSAQAQRTGRQATGQGKSMTRKAMGTVKGGLDKVGLDLNVSARDNTREELYARAKALNIVGRSGMNKSELAAAIRRKQR